MSEAPKKHRNAAWTLNLVGWLVLAVAVFDVLMTVMGEWNGHPFDPALAAETVVLAVIGITASVMAACLKKIEARLSALEERN
jgi:hypothetical protein